MELHWGTRDGSEHRFALDDDRALIGRAPDCDLILHDPEVSAHHLVLAYTDRGWEARDLGSTNGTRLDGRPLTAEVIVVDGQRIEVGDTTLEVRDAASAPARIDPQDAFPPTPTRPGVPVGDPRTTGSILARLRRRRTP